MQAVARDLGGGGHTKHGPAPADGHDDQSEDEVGPPDADEGGNVERPERVAESADRLEERDLAAEEDRVDGDDARTQPHDDEDRGEDEGALLARSEGEHAREDEGEEERSPEIPVLQSINSLEGPPEGEHHMQRLQSNVCQIPENRLPYWLVERAYRVGFVKSSRLSILGLVRYDPSEEIHVDCCR